MLSRDDELGVLKAKGSMVEGVKTPRKCGMGIADCGREMRRGKGAAPVGGTGEAQGGPSPGLAMLMTNEEQAM